MMHTVAVPAERLLDEAANVFVAVALVAALALGFTRPAPPLDEAAPPPMSDAQIWSTSSAAGW